MGAPGGAGLLWQMLCATKIVCANHSNCRPDGQCTWTGDYGSYLEHIRTCRNLPVVEKMEDSVCGESVTTVAKALDSGTSSDSDATCSVAESVDMIESAESVQSPGSEAVVSEVCCEAEDYVESPADQSHEDESDTSPQAINTLVNLKATDHVMEQSCDGA